MIAETFTAVGQHIGQSTNDAAKTIGANTRELNTMLAARSAEISKILDETARPLVERFADSGGELQKSLEAVTEQATENGCARENADARQRARQPHGRDAGRLSKARARRLRTASPI